MFKKIVIADRVALYVNAVYSEPAVYPAMSLALATFFFAFQIYCDFSGYSDIAIGCARVLGFKLMSNFRQPYFAHSIADFWRRWHISLSTWLKDYVYIPLGGSRKGALRRNINLIITFTLSGLWHGAAWHFVFWGLLHGLFQIIERSAGGLLKHGTSRRTVAAPRILIIFALTCLAWVFFRADSLPDTALILGKLSKLPAELAEHTRRLPETGLIASVRNVFQLGPAVANPIADFGLTACGLSFISIAVLLAADFLARCKHSTTPVKTLPLVLRWAGYYALIMVILFCRPMESSQFIYFTF
jgi:hypothetical protein